MTRTEEAACTFVLQETSTSQYAIACRQQEPGLSALADGELMLKLRPGVSFGFAEQVTKFLQQNVAGLLFRAGSGS